MKLLTLCLLLFTTAASGAVVLPVEVMGKAGTVKKVTVTVPKGKGKTAERLIFTAHGLRSAKASVQAGTGSSIVLSNSTATVGEPAKSYGGIGGPFSVLSCSVPVTGIKDGGNVLSFRFNGTDGVNSGFRILSLQLVDAQGAPLIPSTQFKEEDPSTWSAPLPDAASIAEGKRLWETAKLVNSPLMQADILATCSDCHSQSGYDLKYFNYSNYSIIKRASEFHGMTTLEGQQIASYIRTLRGPAPGRPWNPPYQPGPGMDSRPLASWSAGAGTEWFLSSDASMLPYIFPNGINKAAVSTKGYINAREMPLAMQFPDWNHWLPRRHPKDAWGQPFIDSPFNTRYTAIRNTLSTTANLQEFCTSGKMQAELGQWSTRRVEFLTPRQEGVAWTPSYSDQVYSTALWQLVKTWEMMKEFDLEGYGPAPDIRSWYGNIAFMVSPNMLKIPMTQEGIDGSPLTTEYLASVWYAVQLALNPTNQNAPQGQHPMDWAYTYGKLKDLYIRSNVPEPMRLSYLLAKAGQIWDNPAGLDKFRGWSPQDKADVCRLVHVSFKPMWDATPPATTSAVMQACLESWLDKTTEYTAEDYWGRGYADPQQIPKPLGGSGDFGDKVAWMLPEFSTYGVAAAIITRGNVWAKSLWPLGPWKIGPDGTGN